jgi:hypothetical protein
VAITMGAKLFYEFGPFRVEPGERTLLRDGRVVPRPPKAFDVSLILIQGNDLIKTCGRTHSSRAQISLRQSS